MTDLQPAFAQEQVIEQKMAGCGLKRGGFTVKYVDELQAIEIVIGRDAGASSDRFDCIQLASDNEIVTFADVSTQSEYNKRSEELARPRIVEDALRYLEQHGKLGGLPQRSKYSELSEFTRAVEVHCGLKAESMLRIQRDKILFWPQKEPNTADYKKVGCLMASLSAAGITDFEFIGNEQVQETEKH